MIQHEQVDRWGPLADHPSLFGPVVDGEVLSNAPWQALATGAGREIELMAGLNRNEYRLFLPRDRKSTSRTRLGHYGSTGPGRMVKNAYRRAFPDASAEQLWELVTSDWLFRMPTLRLAEAQALGGGRIHLYELTWPAPSAEFPFGAFHRLDLPLLFGDFTTGFGQLLGPPRSTRSAGVLGTHAQGMDEFRDRWHPWLRSPQKSG